MPKQTNSLHIMLTSLRLWPFGALRVMPAYSGPALRVAWVDGGPAIVGNWEQGDSGGWYEVVFELGTGETMRVGGGQGA